MADFLTLADYPLERVRLACERCGRAGDYARQGLIARFGAKAKLPDVREALAGCPRAGDMTAPCGVHYPDMSDGGPARVAMARRRDGATLRDDG